MERGDMLMAAPSAAAGMVAESAAMGDGAPMAFKAAAPGAPPAVEKPFSRRFGPTSQTPRSGSLPLIQTKTASWMCPSKCLTI